MIVLLHSFGFYIVQLVLSFDAANHWGISFSLPKIVVLFTTGWIGFLEVIYCSYLTVTYKMPTVSIPQNLQVKNLDLGLIMTPSTR